MFKIRKKINLRLWIFLITRLTVVIAGIIAIFEKNWTAFGMAILTLIAMVMPSVVERKFNLEIPSEFEIILVLFIYGSLFLGEQRMFYDRFWWWDKLLHGFSGLILGNIGFLIVHYLNSGSKTNLQLNPVFVALFTFCFAVAMGALWEIYEYSMDKLFGFFMQRGSLDDTMTDLILDALGAFVFAVLGYFYQKGRFNLIDKYIIKFEQK